MTEERGVSEVLGFVLIFSMILLMTGIVYTGGAAELREIRDDQQVAGVERAFVAVDSDVTDIVRDGAPTRASTIRLNGGTLAFEGETAINVTVNGSRVNRSVTPMVFRLDGEPRLAYAGGMVARSGGNGGWAVVSEPPTVVTDAESGPPESVLFPIVNTAGSGSAQGARSLTIGTQMDRPDEITERNVGKNGPLEVTINVTGTPRAAAWERYFEAEFDDADCEALPAKEGTSCEFETDAFRAPVYPVDVTFS